MGSYEHVFACSLVFTKAFWKDPKHTQRYLCAVKGGAMDDTGGK